MSIPAWTNEEGAPCLFSEVDPRCYQGTRLAGTIISSTANRCFDITVQEWGQSSYHIAFRLLRFFSNRLLQVREKQQGIRMEAVLTGELITTAPSGLQRKLRAGQYHLTQEPVYLARSKKKKDCQYFVSYYPPELIEDFGVAQSVICSAPLTMPAAMTDILQEVLHHPYESKLHTFYYQHIVRELLLCHLTATNTLLPAALTEAEIAAVYQADALLAADLSEHYSIRELSSMAGTNAFKLKRGFRLIFQTGVFGRLIYRRMEQAKLLLATTSKPIKEVAFESGYNTVAGFITAFGKRFGMTPLEWREEKKGHGK